MNGERLWLRLRRPVAFCADSFRDLAGSGDDRNGRNHSQKVTKIAKTRSRIAGFHSLGNSSRSMGRPVAFTMFVVVRLQPPIGANPLRSLRPSVRVLSVISLGRATIVTEEIIHRRSRRSRRRDPEKPDFHSLGNLRPSVNCLDRDSQSRSAIRPHAGTFLPCRSHTGVWRSRLLHSSFCLLTFLTAPCRRRTVNGERLIPTTFELTHRCECAQNPTL